MTTSNNIDEKQEQGIRVLSKDLESIGAESEKMQDELMKERVYRRNRDKKEMIVKQKPLEEVQQARVLTVTSPKHNKTSFKIGQSGNPKGRPVGSVNWTRKELVQECIGYRARKQNPITLEIEELRMDELMTLVMIKKAIDGDVQAYKEVMDSAYGKNIAYVGVGVVGSREARQVPLSSLPTPLLQEIEAHLEITE